MLDKTFLRDIANPSDGRVRLALVSTKLGKLTLLRRLVDAYDWATSPRIVRYLCVG